MPDRKYIELELGEPPPSPPPSPFGSLKNLSPMKSLKSMSPFSSGKPTLKVLGIKTDKQSYFAGEQVRGMVHVDFAGDISTHPLALEFRGEETTRSKLPKGIEGIEL